MAERVFEDGAFYWVRFRGEVVVARFYANPPEALRWWVLGALGPAIVSEAERLALQPGLFSIGPLAGRPA